MKNIVRNILTVILTAVVITLGFKYYLMTKEYDDFKEKIFSVAKTEKIDSTQYSKLIRKNVELKERNQRLINKIDSLGYKIKEYSDIALNYSKDSVTIKTTKDTIYIGTEENTEIQRKFVYQKDDLFLQGRYQLTEPYRFYLDSISLQIKLSIAITKDRFKNLSYIVDTNSKYLTVRDINISYKEDPIDWKYIYSISLLSKGLIPSKIDGFSATGTLYYKNYGLGITAIILNNDAFVGLNFNYMGIL